jgi:cell fate (sporulation/competence/biofilm development) regulator YlbF (YheA/YmcA/DUF963 family)
MANTSLTPELAKLAGELAAAFANSQKVVAAKARIGLFYQNPEATDLFRKVSEYGETLRNKHMEGMPPSEEELSKFDQLRSAVVENELCKGFLESRQMLDDMLSVVNQYLCLAIEKGSAPSDEEVADSMNQQMSACSCGGGCHGDCGDCDNESCGKNKCDCGDAKCNCGPDCTCGCQEGKECTCGKNKCDCGDAKCNCGPDCTCGCQEGKECTCGDGECCGKHEGHECKCGKH